MQCPRHTPVPELKQYIVWNTHLLSCSWKPPRYGGWSDIMFLKPNWSIGTDCYILSSYIIENRKGWSVADPGFVKREGRKSKFRQAWKSRSVGGTRHNFFFSPLNFFWRHLHYRVGVASAYQTDLRGDKQKKKKKKSTDKKNAPQKGAAADPPPWIRHCW